MRIIAGRLGGRSFESPGGRRTHPMSDKLRGAIFNTLGDIEGLRVLDAFAGSGALGLEALSRGARQVTAIDIDRTAQRAIATNAANLGVNEQLTLIKTSAAAWLAASDAVFDLVLLDPPYDAVDRELLKQLAERAAPGGVVILSLPPATEIQLSGNLKKVAAKTYGDAKLLYYRKLTQAPEPVSF